MLKRYILLTIFLFIISFFTNNTAFADVIYKDFYQIAGSGANVTVRDIKFDSTGNMYAIGYFIGTVDLNPGSGVSEVTSAGGEDMFIVKFDTNEDFVWVKTFGSGSNDRVYGLNFDSNEDIYLTGYFAGNVSFDAVNLSAVGSNDIFYAKLASNDGSVVWAKSVGSGLSDSGFYIGFNPVNDLVYATGTFRSTADFDPGAGTQNLVSAGLTDIYLLILDSSNGDFVSVNSMGSTGTDAAYALHFDSIGNVYISGSFQGTVDFDPGAGIENLTSVGGTDIFVAKYDKDGIFLWARGMGGTGTDESYSVKVDNNDLVYITGPFQGTVDFDPGVGTENRTSLGNNDGFLLKLESNGDFAWVKTIGGAGLDYIDTLYADDSQIYIVGTFSDTVDFDPGAGTENLTSVGGTDIFVVKLEYNNGDLVWAKTMGGAPSESTSSLAFNDNNIYIVGSFSGTSDFDPSSSTNNKTALGSVDGYISVITFAPYLTEVTPIGVSVYPNTLAYTFNTEEEGNISYGGSCSSLTTTTSSGDKTINFSQLSPGTYSDCTIIVTDSNGNASNTLAVSPFTIVVHSGGGGSGPSPVPVPTPIPTPTPTPTPNPNPAPEPTPNPETPINPITNTYTSPIDGSSKSCPGFTKYLRKGNRDNDREETRLWQAFLNKFQNEKLKVDGIYGNLTEAAIKRFQNTYKEYILTPWNLKSPTGYTYQSTRAYANKIVGCSEGLVVLDNGKTINY